MASRDDIQRQVMVIAGYLSAGEPMIKEDADLGLQGIVAEICAHRSPATVAAIAMFLAGQLQQ